MLAGMGILFILLVFLRLRQKRSPVYLLGCAVFGLYLLLAVSQVLFPIPLPEATGGREPAAAILAHVNLVPFNFGRLFESNATVITEQLLGNILLTLPFGFGLPFLARVTPRRMLWLALGVGLSTEAAQLAVSLLIGAGYHSIDINDTLLNAVGVLVGYGLYQGVVKLIRLL